MMSDNLQPLTISGHTRGKDGINREVTGAISIPSRSVATDDYYCCVEMKGILESVKEIFGLTPMQSRILAIRFANQLLEAFTVVDHKGEVVTIDAPAQEDAEGEDREKDREEGSG